MLLPWQKEIFKKYLCDVSLKGIPEDPCFILMNTYNSLKKKCNQAEIVILCESALWVVSSHTLTPCERERRKPSGVIS